MKLKTGGIIGQSTSLAEVFKVLAKVAPTDSRVLVTGESGTGKELIVRALHENSRRAERPFVPINCGAIPKDLLESELFGHEKGAFTSAIRSKMGRFEIAEGGTVFLDEIGEMDLSLQVKILRVLQEGEIERVGGTTKKVDVRIIAATNRDLEAEVAAGRFREDLFYRLNVITLHLPPLRERGGDILLLSQYYLDRHCQKIGRAVLQLDRLARRVLAKYDWPGNVRELENTMERLSLLVDGDVIAVDDLPLKIRNRVEEDPESLPDPEQENLDLAETLEFTSEVTTVTEASSEKEAELATSADEDNEEDNNTSFSQATLAQLPTSTGKFTWPSLETLAEEGMNLKDFLDTIEMRLINEALVKSEGVKNQAAEMLGIKRTTLIEKMKKKNM